MRPESRTDSSAGHRCCYLSCTHNSSYTASSGNQVVQTTVPVAQGVFREGESVDVGISAKKQARDYFDSLLSNYISAAQNFDVFLEETVAVSDSIGRVLGASRGLAESSISSGDSVARACALTRKIGAWAINLDGTNDFIQCGNHTSLWSGSLTKFSFTCWVYATAGWDANTRYIVLHNTASNHGFGLFVHSSVANRLTFRIVDSGGIDNDCWYGSFQLNKWNFVACTYDKDLGSGNAKIFVNGTAGGSNTLTETITLASSLNLGGSTNDLQGILKDFRWFTTVALTTTEMDDIMNDSPSAPTPDYWLKMQEGTGNMIDAIGGLSATLNNGASWVQNSPSVFPSETINVIDSLARTLAKFISLPESVTSGDSVARTISFFRTLAESAISSGDSIARAVTNSRSLPESVSSGDTVDRIVGFPRALIESVISVADDVVRSVTNSRSLPESVSSGDSVARAIALFRAMPENVTSGDSVARFVTNNRSLPESVSVSDFVDRVIGFFRNLPESVSSGDSVTRAVTNSRTLPETVSSGDSIDRVIGFPRNLPESTNVSDQLDRSVTNSRTLPESVSVGDAVNRVIEFFRSLPENVGVSDQLNRSVSNDRSLPESVSVGDLVERFIALFRSNPESVNVSDQLDRAVTNSRTLPETVSSGDSVDRSYGVILYIA